MPDVKVEPLGSVVMVQPLTAAAVTWLDEYADASPWQWQGGALAVDHRTVAALVEGMVSAGLEVEGYALPVDEEAELDRLLLDTPDKPLTVSDLAHAWALDAAHAFKAGLSMLEWQRNIAKRGGGRGPSSLVSQVGDHEVHVMAVPPRPDAPAIIEEMKRLGLLPWEETPSRKKPETP